MPPRQMFCEKALLPPPFPGSARDYFSIGKSQVPGCIPKIHCLVLHGQKTVYTTTFCTYCCLCCISGKFRFSLTASAHHCHSEGTDRVSDSAVPT